MPPDFQFFETHLQMITYEMPIRTLGTCNEDGAFMISTLGNVVRRAMLTWLTCKCELIRGWFLCGDMGVARVLGGVRD